MITTAIMRAVAMIKDIYIASTPPLIIIGIGPINIKPKPLASTPLNREKTRSARNTSIKPTIMNAKPIKNLSIDTPKIYLPRKYING